ncbi:MAG: hypothetical protein AAGM22_30325 [Acidobacteriota bacterium]
MPSGLAWWACGLILVVFGPSLEVMAGLASLESTVAQASAPPDLAFLDRLGTAFKWLLILSVIAFFLLFAVVGLLLWKAKQLVANAVTSNPAKLGKLLAKLRRAHPDLDDEALCGKIILRQSNRAGLVGLVTGLGGLPVLPLALPIDIAATIRLQADMVHLLRLVHGVDEAEVPEAGLWIATAGGMELATAGSQALRGVVVKTISKSLLKFVPLIGGLIGFGLNWASTQTMGRLGVRWLRHSRQRLSG